MGIKIEKVNAKEYKLIENITTCTSAYVIEVKEGIIFDGATIPSILYPIYGSPFTGNYTLPSLVHDALYKSEALKRKECDDIFLELMELANVSYFKRYSMYLGVRIGGYFVWKNHSMEEVESNKKFIKVEK